MLSYINIQLTKVFRLALGLLLISGALLIVTNIFLRYFFYHSIAWTEEVTRYGLIWLVFLGAGVVAREAGHLSIEILPSLLPSRLARLNRVIVNIACAGLSGAVAYIGWQLTFRVQDTGQIGTSSGLPVYLVYIAIPVGCTLMILGFFEAALRHFHESDRRKVTDPQRFES